MYGYSQYSYCNTIFLLNATTGVVTSILNMVRCLVFYYYAIRDLKPSLITLIFFEIIAVISGIISWQNMWSLIPIIVSVIYTYGLWQDDVRIIKITTGMAGLGWSIYNIAVKAYVGVIQQTSQLISSIIALYREKNNKQ